MRWKRGSQRKKAADAQIKSNAEGENEEEIKALESGESEREGNRKEYSLRNIITMRSGDEKEKQDNEREELWHAKMTCDVTRCNVTSASRGVLPR